MDTSRKSYKLSACMNGFNGQNGHGPHGPNDGDDNNPAGVDNNVIRLPTPAERRATQKAQDRAAARATHEPMINLPPVTKWLLAAIVLIHLVINYAIDDVQRYGVFEHFGFIAAHYTTDMPAPLWAKIIGPFTYMFLHGSWLHLLMNGAMLMAFGTGCERGMGGRRLFVMFYLCSMAALVVQFLVSPESTNPVIGASGGLSGLFAAVLLMMQRQGYGAGGRFGLMPFILLWIGISVLFGVMGSPDGSAVAWPAHIGGFLAGFLLFKPVMRLR